MNETAIGRRERKKQQTRQALEDAAWRLFQRKGYDNTTIEDITEAVDVSVRTFFRYYDSKEAVLFGDWRNDVEQVAEFIEQSSPESPVMVILEAALIASAQKMEEDRWRMLLLKKLARTSKSVGDYERTQLYPALEERLGDAVASFLRVDTSNDMRPMISVGAILAVMKAAKTRWSAGDGRESLVDLIRSGLQILRK